MPQLFKSISSLTLTREYIDSEPSHIIYSLSAIVKEPDQDEFKSQVEQTKILDSERILEDIKSWNQFLDEKGVELVDSGGTRYVVSYSTSLNPQFIFCYPKNAEPSSHSLLTESISDEIVEIGILEAGEDEPSLPKCINENQKEAIQKIMEDDPEIKWLPFLKLAIDLAKINIICLFAQGEGRIIDFLEFFGFEIKSLNVDALLIDDQ